MEEISKTFIINKSITKDEFLRHALIALGTDKNAPSNIMDAEFGEIAEHNDEFIVCTCDVVVSYSASIGYDRIETYYEPVQKKDSNGNYYYVKEKRTRKVTDWTPFSGSITTTKTSIANNTHSDNFSLAKLVAKELSNVKDKDIIVENSCLSSINNNSLEIAIDDCKSKARYDIKWPGDQHQDENYVETYTIKDVQCIKATCYDLTYMYEGKKYNIYGVSMGNLNEDYDVPSKSTTAESLSKIQHQQSIEETKFDKEYQPKKIICIVLAIFFVLLGFVLMAITTSLLFMLLWLVSVICIILRIVFRKIMDNKCANAKSIAEEKIKNLEKLKESNLNKYLIKKGFEPISDVIIEDLNNQKINNVQSNVTSIMNNMAPQTTFGTNSRIQEEAVNDRISSNITHIEPEDLNNQKINNVQSNYSNDYTQIKSEIYKDMKKKVLSVIPNIIIFALMINAAISIYIGIQGCDGFEYPEAKIMSIVSLSLVFCNIIFAIALWILRKSSKIKLFTSIFKIYVLINIEWIIANGIWGMIFAKRNISLIFPATLFAVIALLILIFNIILFIKKNSNFKISMFIATPSVTLLAIVGILISFFTIPKNYYDKAMTQLEKNNDNINISYNYEYFSTFNWWSDSSKQYDFAWARYYFIDSIKFKEDMYREEDVQEYIEIGIDYMCNSGGTVNVYYDTNGGSNVNQTNSDTFSKDNWNGHLSNNITNEVASFVRWELTKFNFYDKNYKVDIYLQAKWKQIFDFTLNDDDTYTLSNIKNKSIQNIIIPKYFNKKEVIVIGSYAFSSCHSLTNITIPSSIKIIESLAFLDCDTLQNVYYEGTIEKWCNLNFGGNYSTPMEYAKHLYILNSSNEYEEVTSVKIPNSITNIGDYQFYGLNNISYIIIPSSVTRIGYNAFGHCSSLKAIYCEATDILSISGLMDYYNGTIYSHNEWHYDNNGNPMPNN